MHGLDSRHFAAEDCLDQIAANIRHFYNEKLSPVSQATTSRRADDSRLGVYTKFAGVHPRLVRA
jgi:hypothetical protein